MVVWCSCSKANALLFNTILQTNVLIMLWRGPFEKKVLLYTMCVMFHLIVIRNLTLIFYSCCVYMYVCFERCLFWFTGSSPTLFKHMEILVPEVQTFRRLYLWKSNINIVFTHCLQMKYTFAIFSPSMIIHLEKWPYLPVFQWFRNRHLKV